MIAVARRVGWVVIGVIVWVVAASLLLAGCAEEPFLRGPEGAAITFVAVRGEALDAEVLWTGVHPEIQTQTSRSDFVDCSYGRAGQSGPTAPASAVPELEPSIFGVALYGGEVPSDNVLVRGDIRYSIGARTEDSSGIISVDVRTEGPSGTSMTTVLLTERVEDPHEPASSSAYWSAQGILAVVGTVPEDECFVGAEVLRDRIQTTGKISVGYSQDQLAELADYRVLAVVWDGTPDNPNLVGAGFWWVGDDGNGGDGIHPPRDGAIEEIEDDGGNDGDVDAEPRRPADWVDDAYLLPDTVRIEPGTYTIEVWANPNGLSPSANPYVPAETTERRCSMDVEVTAGSYLNVHIEDYPVGGECPRGVQPRWAP